MQVIVLVILIVIYTLPTKYLTISKSGGKYKKISVS